LIFKRYAHLRIADVPNAPVLSFASAINDSFRKIRNVESKPKVGTENAIPK